MRLLCRTETRLLSSALSLLTRGQARVPVLPRAECVLPVVAS